MRSFVSYSDGEIVKVTNCRSSSRAEPASSAADVSAGAASAVEEDLSADPQADPQPGPSRQSGTNKQIESLHFQIFAWKRRLRGSLQVVLTFSGCCPSIYLPILARTFAARCFPSF